MKKSFIVKWKKTLCDQQNNTEYIEQKVHLKVSAQTIIHPISSLEMHESYSIALSRAFWIVASTRHFICAGICNRLPHWSKHNSFYLENNMNNGHN